MTPTPLPMISTCKTNKTFYTLIPVECGGCVSCWVQAALDANIAAIAADQVTLECTG